MTTIDPIITKEILKLIAEIDEFKGQWRALKVLSPEILSQLRRIATIESAGSSTRIEGARLSDKEVGALLANLEVESFQNRDEEEVAGYVAAMEMAFESWASIPVTENHIRQLHRVLLQYCNKDERHRGDYKTMANHVAAFDAEGKQIGIVFETASPFETPLEMEKLLRWFEEAQRDGGLHPLLVTGIFIVWFLAIHPFQDGNGRLSRVLTMLMLLRAGYAYVPYTSLESIIEESKAGYYAALRSTQLTLKSTGPDWEPWLVFFLRCVARQKERLAARVEAEQKIPMQLSGLAVEIVNLLGVHTSITVAAVVESTGANRNTVKAALKGLAKRNLITKRGKGRGAHYTLVA